jgi:hypothetical protein
MSQVRSVTHVSGPDKLSTGAARGIRTPDPVITNDVLYQLSYCGGPCGGFGGSEAPAPDIGERPILQGSRRVPAAIDQPLQRDRKPRQPPTWTSGWLP